MDFSTAHMKLQVKCLQNRSYKQILVGNILAKLDMHLCSTV